MSANSDLKTQQANIKVVGIGGAGSNAVDRMISAGVKNVEFVAMNTDVQALDRSTAPTRLHIGPALTRGLGAGGDPEKGKGAVEESKNEIRKALEGADMVFIAAGMGGGTGTGGAPALAEIAREMGALTVAVVNKPFSFEGSYRRKLAEEGLATLMGRVDTVIAIPNDRILKVVERRATMPEALRKVDEVLQQGVQGIADIITVPGVINVDFADVRAIMTNAGPALMGIGYGVGDQRAIQAAESAVHNQLVDTSIEGAKAVLLNITCSESFSMTEANEAAQYIQSLCDRDEANIITGFVIDPSMEDTVRITVLATGFDPSSLANRQAEDSTFALPKPASREVVDTVRERSSLTARREPEAEPTIDEADFNVPAFIRENRARAQS